MNIAKLSPSDFAFTYHDCKRCFYLKVMKDIPPPSKPVPTIFSKIDEQEKAAFQNLNLKDINPDFPDGSITASDLWVASKYMDYPELDYKQYIKGRLDSLVKMNDGTYQIIDFKTSDPQAFIAAYTRQLHAYAYCLEHPMSKMDELDGKISGIGLLVFEPISGFSVDNECNGILKGTLKWKELPYTPDKFLGFMDKIANLLSGDEPDFNPDCPYCKRDLSMISMKEESENDLRLTAV